MIDTLKFWLQMVVFVTLTGALILGFLYLVNGPSLF